MEKRFYLSIINRLFALALAILLALPSPAIALRQAGLEENSAKKDFPARISAASGLEKLPE